MIIIMMQVSGMVGIVDGSLLVLCYAPELLCPFSRKKLDPQVVEPILLCLLIPQQFQLFEWLGQ